MKMDTIFMNSENSKTPKLHVLILKLTNKLVLRLGEKTVALSNLSIYCTWKNIKSSYNNNKFKISAPTWNDKFELLDESYSTSDIQDYFEYILKKYGEIKGKVYKILTHKQMLQRLPIALAQVKAGNNSESLLNETRQIVYSLYQLKQITKKVYNNIIKSI